MAKHNKEEVQILGGKATIYTNDYGVWQFRLWLTTDNKYVRKSLRTKVKDYAITEGEKLYIQIRARGHSGFPLGLISDSNFQNGGLNERATVCGIGRLVAAA